MHLASRAYILESRRRFIQFISGIYYNAMQFITIYTYVNTTFKTFEIRIIKSNKIKVAYIMWLA